MGTCSSIDLETGAVVTCVVPMAERSIFGNIIGEIISPVKSVILDAFNTFKGPVGDIVQFVVSNVLSGLIQFIAQAIEDIFPGLGYIAGKSVTILEQLIGLVPVAAGLLKAGIESFIDGVDSIFTIAHDAIDGTMAVIVTAFGDFTKLCNTAMSKLKKLIARTSLIVTTGVDDLANLGTQVGTTAVKAIETGLNGLNLVIAAIPTVIFTSIEDGIKTGSAALITIVNALTSIVNSLVSAIESIIITLVNTIGTQVDDAVVFVQNGVKSVTAIALEGLQLAQTELAGAGGVTSELVGTCIHGGNYACRESKRVVGEAATTVQKGLGAANDGAKGIVDVIDDILQAIDHSQTYVAGGLLLGTVMVAFMVSKDLQ